MWVEKTKTGKYKYTERYTDYMTGKIRRVSVTMEKNNPSTKKLARQALLRIIEERQNEEPEEVQPLTLLQLVEHYRAYQKQSVKESTYRRNFYQCKALLEILGADVLVENLTANYIKERFLQTGEAFSTLNERRIRLIALLNWGYENDYITDVAYLRKFKPFKDATHREKIQDKYLESKELTTLIRGIEIKKWQQLTRFLVLSGLRIGEALALTAADLDMYNKVIHVNKTSFSADQEPVFTHPCEQPVLSDIHTVLFQDLCQLPDQDAGVRHTDRIRKHFFRSHPLHIFHKACITCFEFLNLLICHFQSTGKNLFRCVPCFFKVKEILAVLPAFFVSLDHADLFCHVDGNLIVNGWSASCTFAHF